MKGNSLKSVLLALLVTCAGFFLTVSSASGGMEAHSGMHDGGNAGSGHHAAEPEIVAHLTTQPQHVTVGVPTTVKFTIDDAEGKPVQGLTVMHARYLHVVIVSQDFSVFAHVHPRDFERLTPEVLKSGRFFVRFTFPRAGRYAVGLDFAVKGRHFGRHFIVNVAGGPEMTPARKDFAREERVDGLDVGFSTKPSRLVANRKAVLTYIFRKDGRPVTDLEPWLEAPMHLAIVSSDLKYFLHVHGEVPGMEHAGHEEGHMHMHMSVPSEFGPEIEVPVVFPGKGLYEVYGQAGYKGKVILTKFMVDVQ